MTTPLQEKKRDYTRSQLVTAAARCFAELGYVTVTVADIVKEVGCSRATFYLHFDSKLAVMQGVLDDVWPEPVSAGQRLLHLLQQGMTAAQVRTEIERERSAWNEHPGLLTAVLVATSTEPELSEWVRRRHLIGIAQLDPWIRELPRDRQRKTRAKMLLLQNLNLTSYSLPDRYPGDMTDDDVLESLAEMWEQFVTGAPSEP